MAPKPDLFLKKQESIYKWKLSLILKFKIQTSKGHGLAFLKVQNLTKWSIFVDVGDGCYFHYNGEETLPPWKDKRRNDRKGKFSFGFGQMSREMI